LDVVAAAVVTPGIVDESAGVVRYASNLEWKDMPLREHLSAALGLPIAIGHDVRAAARAEQLVGAAYGIKAALFVQIGTGIAAAQIAGGVPIAGSGGAAGEFGHIPLVAGGELCTCGQRGCLEVYVSGAGLARRYLAASGTALPAHEISRLVGHDGFADQVWDTAVQALAQGLVTATLLMDPGMIILSGGFTNSGQTLLLPLNEAIADGLRWRAPAPLVRSSLGAAAGIIGAAAIGFELASFSSAVERWHLGAEADLAIPSTRSSLGNIRRDP
jgi:glucokinase